MGTFDHRLHLICAPEDASEVSAALEKLLPEWLSWAPVGEVDPLTQQIPEPRCYVDSGQWTEEQAAVLVAACAGLPVNVVRGPALIDEPRARRTIERAVEEWEGEQASQAAKVTKEKVQ